MLLRIRIPQGRPVQRKSGKNRHIALAAAALLGPAALMAYVLGFWRLAADMGVAGEFGINGIFSHWQVWMAVAAALHLIASGLNKYGRGGDLHVPRVLTPRILPFRRRL